MNKITRETAKELGFDFNELIQDLDETSYEEHRRGSNFFKRSIVAINEQWFPEVSRELDGFWETNTYVWDDTHGADLSEIHELNRVEQRERVVTTRYWARVE